jgi:CheY-like chemotaxis protein
MTEMLGFNLWGMSALPRGGIPIRNVQGTAESQPAEPGDWEHEQSRLLARDMRLCDPMAPRAEIASWLVRSQLEEAWVGAPHRALVIEDDPALRELLCEALEGEGYHVLPSDHPVAPLDVQQLRPSLVVLDLMLGGEPEGYGWLEAVRAWRWTARLPVLVCSGYLESAAPAAHRVEALANATVPKPFALDQFLAAVAGCMEKAAAPRPA